MIENEITSNLLDVAAGEAEQPEEPYGAKLRWEPRTLQDVEYIVGKVLAAETVARAIRDRAERMARDSDDEAAWWRQRYAPEVVEIVQAEIATRRGKKRSVDLLTGVAGFRLVPENIVIDKDQEEEALAWASQYLPEAVTIIPATASLSRSALKQRLVSNGDGDAIFASTGEKVHFARVEAARDTFYIKPASTRKPEESAVEAI